MTKSESREVTRTIAALESGIIGADVAARALASLYRAARSEKSRDGIKAAIRSAHLVSFITVEEHGVSFAI